jgi:acyl carrier protein
MRDKVISLVSEQSGCSVEKINEDKSFEDDLGMDELDMIELVMYVEEEFQKEISDEEQSKLITVGDLIQLVEEKSKED